MQKNQEGLAGALLSFFLLLCQGPRGSGVGNAECNEAKSPQGNAGGPIPRKKGMPEAQSPQRMNPGASIPTSKTMAHQNPATRPSRPSSRATRKEFLRMAHLTPATSSCRAFLAFHRLANNIPRIIVLAKRITKQSKGNKNKPRNLIPRLQGLPDLT